MALLSLFVRKFSPKNPLSVCYPPEDFGEGAAENFGPLSIFWWGFFFFFFFSIWFVRIVLNACLSVADKVPPT